MTAFTAIYNFYPGGRFIQHFFALDVSACFVNCFSIALVNFIIAGRKNNDKECSKIK